MSFGDEEEKGSKQQGRQEAWVEQERRRGSSGAESYKPFRSQRRSMISCVASDTHNQAKERVSPIE